MIPNCVEPTCCSRPTCRRYSRPLPKKRASFRVRSSRENKVMAYPSRDIKRSDLSKSIVDNYNAIPCDTDASIKHTLSHNRFACMLRSNVPVGDRPHSAVHRPHWNAPLLRILHRPGPGEPLPRRQSILSSGTRSGPARESACTEARLSRLDRTIQSSRRW